MIRQGIDEQCVHVRVDAAVRAQRLQPDEVRMVCIAELADEGVLVLYPATKSFGSTLTRVSRP